jgi:hypothetical protein
MTLSPARSMVDAGVADTIDGRLILSPMPRVFEGQQVARLELQRKPGPRKHLNRGFRAAQSGHSLAV